mgnify:CR=1 FL=1
MANNLWQTKYPAFGELSVAARREYWSTIFRAYKAMYASASAPAATMEDEERVIKLVVIKVQVCQLAEQRTEQWMVRSKVVKQGTLGRLKCRHCRYMVATSVECVHKCSTNCAKIGRAHV